MGCADLHHDVTPADHDSVGSECWNRRIPARTRAFVAEPSGSHLTG